ncbi:MAG: ferritin-like domain-containing protein [Pseudonocardiaceae bacterium]
MRSGSNRAPAMPSRRAVLRYGALAVLAVPLAACGTGYDDAPDPLDALARAARADGEAARTLATSGGGGSGGDVANAVSRVRFAHADAMQREVRRANRPPAPSAPPAEQVIDLSALGDRLAAAAKAARDLGRTAPRYRAGLLGSVAAGCAAAQALSPSLGEPPEFEFDTMTIGGNADQESVAALQLALDTEHAAVWAYGLVTAFLPGDFTESLDDAVTEHRARRDACRGALAKAGATPNSAEAAYLPPDPVDDIPTAMSVVIAAETDTAVAWRAVLERTDHAALRGFGLDALTASGTRATRWRAESGDTHAATALPGLP